MPQRTLYIDQLIINSPYDEPAEYWKYDRESRLHTRTPGRRPAGYVVATPGSRSFDDPGVFHHGLMSTALLEAILDKAVTECTVAGVALFNWTEPLLHPAIHELIRVVRTRGIHCSISTNLNVLRDPALLMAAGPDWLRVSVSGFTQDVYARGHAAGDIETVKRNMRRLAEAKARTAASTDLEVYYHKYVDNEADEAPMRAYAEALGYRFASDWALIMPLEKTLTIADPAAVVWEPDGGLTLTAPTIIQNLEPVQKVFDACKQTQEITVEVWLKNATAAPADLSGSILSAASTRKRLAALQAMLVARLVFPIPGRPARMIRSERWKPPAVILSRSAKPEGTPYLIPSPSRSRLNCSR